MVRVSADGNRIVDVVSAWSDKSARVWDANGAHVIAERIVPREEAIWDVAVNHDGTQVVFSRMVHRSGKRRVDLVHVQSGTLTPESRDSFAETNFSMNADGVQIPFEAPNHTIVVWDVPTQKQLTAPLVGHTKDIQNMTFSADGTRLVSASLDHTGRVWHTATGEPIGEPFRHPLRVAHVQSDQHDSLVVSYNRQAHGRLWDVARGHCFMISTHPDWSTVLHRFNIDAINGDMSDFSLRRILRQNSAGHCQLLATRIDT